MGNATAQLVNLHPAHIEALRYDLSYEASDAAPTPTWDGWYRLMTETGVFPSGLVPQVRRLLDKYGFAHEFTDARPVPDEEIPLWTAAKHKTPRPYQTELADAALQKGRGVIVAPPRGGKTFVGALIYDKNPLPTVWICPTRGIVNQTVTVLRELFPGTTIVGLMGGKQGNAKIRERQAARQARIVVVTAATAVKLGREFFNTRGMLIVDEFHHCFSPTTLVASPNGPVAISQLRPGDFVLADTAEGIRPRKVLRVWRRTPPATMLRITTTIGSVVVTDEHKIFTPEGKVRAGDLRAGSVVHLREMRSDHQASWSVQGARERLPRSDEDNENVSALQQGDPQALSRGPHTVLLGQESSQQSRHSSASNGHENQEHDPSPPTAAQRVDAPTESQSFAGESIPNDSEFQKGDRRGPRDSLRPRGRRQRLRSDGVGAGSVAGAEAAGVCTGAGGEDRPASRGGGNLVQPRLCARSEEGCSGDRRIFSSESTGRRRPEGCVASVGRLGGDPCTCGQDRRSDCVVEGQVLSVEVLPTACTEVFDLEVEHDHNYFAEGLKVSNSAAETYQEINRQAENIYYRFGMTGTHERSDANTEILMNAVLSEIVGDVDIGYLVANGWLAPARVFLIPIEGPRVYATDPDGAYRFGIAKHELRNQWVAWAARTLAAAGRRVLVLVKWVDEHGVGLAEALPEATFVHGKSEVEESIDAFNAGQIPILIGTSVLGEGRDLPAADGLVYAKGGKASVTVKQDVYRVLTAHALKTDGVVVDFADRHNPNTLRHSIARGRIYGSYPSFEVEMLPPELISGFQQRVQV
jgi:superfamily II DNA or RNA helicase